MNRVQVQEGVHTHEKIKEQWGSYCRVRSSGNNEFLYTYLVVSVRIKETVNTKDVTGKGRIGLYPVQVIIL